MGEGGRGGESSTHASCVQRLQWVVGRRFQYVAHMTLAGEEGEPIQAFIWRVVGALPVGGYHAALEDVRERWMGEDACADNPEACAALVEALDLQARGMLTSLDVHCLSARTVAFAARRRLLPVRRADSYRVLRGRSGRVGRPAVTANVATPTHSASSWRTGG